MRNRGPSHRLSLRERIDVLCALVGVWGSAILKYFDDAQHGGVADYSGIIEILEIAELSGALAFPLLMIGIAGSGRVFWTTWRGLPARSRLARSGLLPRR